LKQQSNIAHNY